MTIEDIKQGESEVLEFKREFPDKERKVLKTIVAFANGNGGNVVIGVDDETLKIVGISSSIYILVFAYNPTLTLGRYILPSQYENVSFQLKFSS